MKKAGLVLLLVTLFFGFQNCGQYLAKSDGDMDTSISNPPLVDCEPGLDCSLEIEAQNTFCFFNGQPVASGLSVTAFASPEADPCQSEVRACADGVLSGSFPYKACVAPNNSDLKTCSFNGDFLQSGDTVTAFLNDGGTKDSPCQSEERVCGDGVLSGSYQWSRCSQTQRSCLFNGRTLIDKEYVQAFKTAPDGSCLSEFRVCSDGVLQGSYAFSSCVPGKKACTFNAQTLLHGESQKAFGSFELVAGICSSEKRVCNDGSLSGGLIQPSCQHPSAGKTCLFSGRILNDGEAVAAFRQVDGIGGLSCDISQRVCKDGELSGDSGFNLLSCTPNGPKACQVFDSAINDGGIVKSFQYNAVVSSAVSCEDYARTSRCVDGVLDVLPHAKSFCESNPLQFPKDGQKCSHGGMDYEHGDSRWFYRAESVDYTNQGSGCFSDQNSVFLRCENGVMKPTRYDLRISRFNITPFASRNCTETGRSCILNGAALAHQQKFRIFNKESVAFGSANGCYSQAVTLSGACIDGQLMDDKNEKALNPVGYSFNSCEETGAQCSFEGVNYDHNQSVGSFYKQSVVPFISAEPNGRDRSCIENDNLVGVRCVDGTLSVYDPGLPSRYRPFDQTIYPSRTCRVKANTCSIDGQVYQHGEQFGKRYKLNLVPYVDPTSTCSDNGNSVSLICINGEAKEWRDEASMITLTGSGSMLSLPEPAKLVNLAEYPERQCLVDAKNCDLEHLFVRFNRDPANPNLFQTVVQKRQVSGLGGRVGSLYKQGQRPLGGDGKSTCQAADNVQTDLYCVNGVVTKTEPRTIKEGIRTRTVQLPVGTPIDLMVYKFRNCRDG